MAVALYNAGLYAEVKAGRFPQAHRVDWPGPAHGGLRDNLLDGEELTRPEQRPRTMPGIYHAPLRRHPYPRVRGRDSSSA